MPANLTPECKAGGGIPQGARELIPIAFLRAIRQPLHAVTGDAAAPTWLVAEVMAVSKNKKSDTTIGPTRLRTSKECVKAIRTDTVYANAGWLVYAMPAYVRVASNGECLVSKDFSEWHKRCSVFCQIIAVR